jgi:hypothetical protein
VPAFIHHAEHIGKLFRVHTLLRFELMLSEKQRDRLKLIEAPHPILPSIAVILTYPPETEETLQSVQDVEIAVVLHDAKFRDDLKADFDRWASLDTDAEAPFSVSETNHPIRTEFHRDCQPLL